MGINKEKRSVIEKSNFYRLNEIKCHVTLMQKGKFKNGMFVSELQDSFFWFMENESSDAERLFISDILNITDYKERGDC